MLSTKPKEQVKVLIVDDQKDQSFGAEINWRDSFKEIANNEKLDLVIHAFVSAEEAIEFCFNHRVHVILLGKELREKNGKKVYGLDFIKTFHELQPWTQIIILAADNSYIEMAQAIRNGASNYLLKEQTDDYTAYRETVLSEALRQARLAILDINNIASKTAIDSVFVCNSPAMKFFDQKLNAVAESSWPILLCGEIGLGKESAARRIHECRTVLYKTTDRPFVSINIGSLNDEFAQVEIFGCEANESAGGNSKTKPGLLDAAAGGDIFLDDIAEAGPELQQKILKIIEERKFTRVGGTIEIPTDARFIFATNRYLAELVEKNLFSTDLFMRISAFEIKIPKLSERKEDLPDIIRHMLKKALKNMPDKFNLFEQFPKDLIDYLTRDHIQGNLRGIESDVLRLVTYSHDSTEKVQFNNWKSVLGVAPKSFRKKVPLDFDKHLELSTFINMETNLLSEGSVGLKVLRDLFEQKLVEEAMKKNNHNLRLAALNLKIATSHLHTKMRQFKIPTKREISNEPQRSKNLSKHKRSRSI